MNLLQHLAQMLTGDHLQGNNHPQSNPQPAGSQLQVQGFHNGNQLQGSPLPTNVQGNAGAAGLLGHLAHGQQQGYTPAQQHHMTPAGSPIPQDMMNSFSPQTRALAQIYQHNPMDPRVMHIDPAMFGYAPDNTVQHNPMNLGQAQPVDGYYPQNSQLGFSQRLQPTGNQMQVVNNGLQASRTPYGQFGQAADPLGWQQIQ